MKLDESGASCDNKAGWDHSPFLFAGKMYVLCDDESTAEFKFFPYITMRCWGRTVCGWFTMLNCLTAGLWMDGCKVTSEVVRDRFLIESLYNVLTVIRLVPFECNLHLLLALMLLFIPNWRQGHSTSKIT